METRGVWSKDFALECVLLTEQNRQYAYNVTLWCVGITIVTLEKQQYVPFLLLLTYVAVNNKQCAVLPWKCKNGFPWQRWWVAKYFVRLPTKRAVWRLNATWPIILLDFNGIWSLSTDSRIKVPNVKFRGNPFSWSRAGTQTGQSSLATNRDSAQKLPNNCSVRGLSIRKHYSYHPDAHIRRYRWIDNTHMQIFWCFADRASQYSPSN